ncbi:SIR2 family protein [Xanthomonas vesicatoria ATCC 35937]|uniref:Uncharacterized protein n=3 Tax=Xanthomonas vesicatoria TaxID=56460 RepID=F0B8A0_9XANT|nr:SIR2 family protein [Xanthomonas vesicatoria ATCC 35937]EGD11349.1 hypothetical protein XVE_0296 [Xanthomonas vesicatoria ATCC 35937]KTF34969.1 Sir2-family regulator [Xanthomonas vesicatoria]
MLRGREFATKFALQPGNFAWFLGAGASASGRIPTGYAMIRDFKKELFCRATGMSRREVDSTDPLWIERIDSYLESEALLPPPGHPTEYACAFEAVYPSAADRRLYIDKQVSLGKPSFGHRVLASLLVSGRAPCVFTTNFDSLVETAATLAREVASPAERATLTVAAIDNAVRALRCLRQNDWPLLAKIHGDFQSEDLKNTRDELQAQDEAMRKVLSEACRRFALIVVGYSGRDTSVMNVLGDALDSEDAFPGGIYWMTRDASELLPEVTRFLEQANAQGISANIVECQNFDEFAGDIADALEFSEGLIEHIRGAEPEPFLRLAAMPSHEARRDPILRFSAVRLSNLPTVARRFELGRPAEVLELRTKLREHKAKAIIAAVGKSWAAFGSDTDILRALDSYQPRLAGTIALDPHSDSWAKGLLYDALVRALCRGRPLHPRLKRSGHTVLVSSGSSDEAADRRAQRERALGPLKAAYGASLYGRVKDLGFPYAEALTIRLEEVDGAWWCVFDPFTQVDLPLENFSAAEVPQRSKRKPNPAADWIREQWAKRYNSRWSGIIDAWSSLLAGEARAFWIRTEEGVDAEFHVSSVTAWSVPSHDHPYFQRRAR